MLEKTRAVVLQTIPYSEASIILKAYTQTKGIQSFLVNGVRKQHARFAPSLFQPLALIELVAYFKKPGGLHRVSDVVPSPPLHEITSDLIKTTVALFLAEVLYRSIREEETNPELFSFLDNSIQLFDLTPGNVSRFHLSFMVQLSRYLGFYPSGRYSNSSPFFDLQEGCFIPSAPLSHPFFLDARGSSLFDRLLLLAADQNNEPLFTPGERKMLLDALVLWYELHHTQGLQIRSHSILSEVLG